MCFSLEKALAQKNALALKEKEVCGDRVLTHVWDKANLLRL